MNRCIKCNKEAQYIVKGDSLCKDCKEGKEPKQEPEKKKDENKMRFI